MHFHYKHSIFFKSIHLLCVTVRVYYKLSKGTHMKYNYAALSTKIKSDPICFCSSCQKFVLTGLHYFETNCHYNKWFPETVQEKSPKTRLKRMVEIKDNFNDWETKSPWEELLSSGKTDLSNTDLPTNLVLVSMHLMTTLIWFWHFPLSSNHSDLFVWNSQ